MKTYKLILKNNPTIINIIADECKEDPITLEMVYFKKVNEINQIVGKFRTGEIVGWCVEEW